MNNRSALNAGKTIDHTVKSTSAYSISIPSYQHGRPYILPEKKLPSSINFRKQQPVSIQIDDDKHRIDEIMNPTTVDHHISNLNSKIKKLNDKKA